VGYNAQVAVDAKHKLIVAQEVTNAGSDLGLLAQTAGAAKEVLGVARIDAEYLPTDQPLGSTSRCLLSMHHVVRGPHYRARPNPATPVRRVPFGCSDIRRNISHTEASYVAADPLSIDHRTVPKPVVAHRTFHGKFAGVPVYDHENELALFHRSTPETEICFPSRRHPCGAARGPVLWTTVL